MKHLCSTVALSGMLFWTYLRQRFKAIQINSIRFNSSRFCTLMPLNLGFFCKTFIFWSVHVTALISNLLFNIIHIQKILTLSQEWLTSKDQRSRYNTAAVWHHATVSSTFGFQLQISNDQWTQVNFVIFIYIWWYVYYCISNGRN